MPFISLKFKPGVNRDTTNYAGEGNWWQMDKVRFLSGFPQKIGGWAKATPNSFLGTCRFLWNWITTYADNFLAVGTNLKLYLEAGGYFYDITPLRDTNPTYTTPASDNCIATTSGSTTVTITITGCNPIAGNYIQISGATTVGGVPAAELNANHEILTAPNANSFTIAVTTAASSTVASGGGTGITVSFEITTGNVGGELGYGWGTDGWSRLEWGLGGVVPIALQPRIWWYDNFDNDLVANIENGALYYWERGTNSSPATALTTRAALLETFPGASDVPEKVMQILVSQQDKHLLAFGCDPYGGSGATDFDPLLIRWADQDNPFVWTPTPTNSAGFLRVSRGSRIVRALPTRQEILTWTDTHLYTLQFTGTTDVFQLQEYADNISIAGAKACISANNVTFWMGQDKFYAYTGRVETLPTTLRNQVFGNINLDAGYQVVAGTNEAWNEVWWMYPSADSNYPNRYVIFNYNEKIWYYGEIDRTGWLDSPLRNTPMAVNTPFGSDIGYLYYHEDGVDADGAPLESYIISNDFDISDGEQFMLTRRLLPDLKFTGSNAAQPQVQIQLRPRRFPGNPATNSVTDEKTVIETSVDSYTEQVYIRARARQMGLKVGSTGLGVQWQLGNPRLDARLDGKR
jgi:hypothetical protein